MLDLDDCNDDEVQRMCEELQRIRGLLELVSPEHIREVVNTSRKRIVITCKSTARVHCAGLEVVKYHAMG